MGSGFDNRTLYDWLDLLIVPVVLAVGGFLLNRAGRISDREIALERSREEILKNYLADIAQLLLENNLSESTPGSDVQAIARAQTVTALRQLDGKRNSLLLRFLREAGLFKKKGGEQAILRLNDTDLSEIDFTGSDLRGVDLTRANLDGTNLTRARLGGAKLSQASLVGAVVVDADLGILTITAKDDIALFTKGPHSEETVDEDGHRVLTWKSAIVSSGANLSESVLKNTDFSKARMEGVLLMNADLTGAIFKGANLNSVKLEGAKYTIAQLKQARCLDDVTFPSG